MKSNLLYVLFVLVSFSFSAKAQKAKIGNEIARVAKVSLPSYYSEPENRTYIIKVVGNYSSEVTNSGSLTGFTKKEDNPNFKVVMDIGTYSIINPELQKRDKEEKNKEGQVTKKWTEYWLETGATMKSGYQVYARELPDEIGDMEKNAEPEKETGTDNPFLTDKDVEKAGSVVNTVDVNANYTMLYSDSREVTEKRQTKVYKSSKEAYDEFQNKLRFELENLQPELANRLYNDMASRANSRFAYQPYNETIYLKKFKNDDHPDAKEWNQAVEASKVLFQTIAYDQPIDEAQEKFKPIVAYFKGVADKYSAEDKKELKVKQAALLNIYYILYNLDQHAELIETANQYLDLKKLDKHAKKNIVKSERQLELLTFNQMKTAHLSAKDQDENVVLDSVEDSDGDDLDED